LTIIVLGYHGMKPQFDIIGFGELLLRLGANGFETLDALPCFQPYIGGAEANVMVGLSRLGWACNLISVLPKHDLASGARDELRRHGVGISDINWVENGRLGLYFFSQGAVSRPSNIVYDRQGSAFAQFDFSAINWSELLSEARYFHVSGVTAALGRNAYEAVKASLNYARIKGMISAYDGNFRPKLWEVWDKDPAPLIKSLMKEATLLFAGPKDMAMVLGRQFSCDLDMAKACFDQFPSVNEIIYTRREVISSQHNRLQGVGFRKDEGGQIDHYETPMVDMMGIVDRIGGGDAFAAGYYHGHLLNAPLSKCLELGVAAAMIKHATHGDFARLNQEDLTISLNSLMGGPHLDVRR
jgi:2-dehydro-3-deoxygluconokinase